MAAVNSTLAGLECLRAAQQKLRDALVAPNTERGYRYDWAAFARWCRGMELEALPASADTLALYVAFRLTQNCKTTTIRRNVSAVLQQHRLRGYPAPAIAAVCELLRGARRLRPERVRQVRPLTIENVRAIVALLARRADPAAVRNRALILAGFASSLRCSSVAALLVDDVEFTPQGAILRIGREKQDQEGRGRLIGLPHGKHPETCPVAAVRDWMERRGPWQGPLFSRLDRRLDRRIPLQPEQIGKIVQQCCRLIGLEWRKFGGHSMRSGFITAAGEAGASDLLIAEQSGHRDMAVLRAYFRRQNVFRSNPCGLLDL